MVSYEHTPVTVEGKRTVVVGGTSGIGQAIALGLASEGADVVATSRREDAVAETTDASWDLVTGVLLDGVRRLTQATEEGSFVKVSSLAARLGLANAPAYSAAKGGVEATDYHNCLRYDRPTAPSIP